MAYKRKRLELLSDADETALSVAKRVTDTMWDASDNTQNLNFWAHFTEWCVPLMKVKAGRDKGDHLPLSSHELIAVIPGLCEDVMYFHSMTKEGAKLYPFSNYQSWTYALEKCAEEFEDRRLLAMSQEEVLNEAQSDGEDTASFAQRMDEFMGGQG
jgi:hypothetical protein